MSQIYSLETLDAIWSQFGTLRAADPSQSLSTAVTLACRAQGLDLGPNEVNELLREMRTLPLPSGVLQVALVASPGRYMVCRVHDRVVVCFLR